MVIFYLNPPHTFLASLLGTLCIISVQTCFKVICTKYQMSIHVINNQHLIMHEFAIKLACYHLKESDVSDHSFSLKCTFATFSAIQLPACLAYNERLPRETGRLLRATSLLLLIAQLISLTAGHDCHLKVGWEVPTLIHSHAFFCTIERRQRGAIPSELKCKRKLRLVPCIGGT